MPSLYAKLKDTDDSFRARKIELFAKGKSVLTPRRSLSLTPSNMSESRQILNKRARGINEIPYVLNSERLNAIDSDKEKQEQFAAILRRTIEKINHSKEIVQFLFFFEDSGKYPTDKQIEYLANIVCHPFNDIVMPPIIRASGEGYSNYLRKFLKALRQIDKNLEVMGTIPRVAQSQTEEICDLYSKDGVKLFALDLEGGNPIDAYMNINAIARAMNKIEKENKSGEECCYLHAINVKRPRALEKKGIASARDILVYPLGFNSFGSSHLRPKLPKEIWEKLAKGSKRGWLFNRRDYGYYSIAKPESRSIRAEEDSSFGMEDIINSTRDNVGFYARMFNVERQGIESVQVQENIKERELAKYLSSKSVAEADIEKIRKRLAKVNE